MIIICLKRSEKPYNKDCSASWWHQYTQNYQLIYPNEESQWPGNWLDSELAEYDVKSKDSAFSRVMNGIDQLDLVSVLTNCGAVCLQ